MPRLVGAGGPARLAYCTNLHEAEGAAGLAGALGALFGPVRERVLGAGPMGLGLFLPAPVAYALDADPEEIARLRGGLAGHGLFCATLNAFPYAGFQAARVKDAVYRPAWWERERLRYTLACARVLSALLPDDLPGGTLSSCPIGWRRHREPGAVEAACALLAECAEGLERIADETGRSLRVALEPEPGCIVERGPEAIDLFDGLARIVPADRIARHLGVCIDCCHQVVLGEDPGEVIRAIDAAGVPVGKVHLTSALEGPLDALERFDEERFLHQTVAVDGSFRFDDLGDALADPARRGARVRTHFHVPVSEARLAGGLETTRGALEGALDAALALAERPDLEVETYTWSVLPDPPADVRDGIAAEMAYVLGMLAARGLTPGAGYGG